MIFQNVCVESFACVLPPEVLTTDELEAKLEPVYRRLRLPEGRLELMTGIQERRLWKSGQSIGGMSAITAKKALEQSGVDQTEVRALIHGSVCRDYLEPATACGVHRELGLPDACLVMDLSNACLGLLNGMALVANMIELGQIRAGVVVGTESSRSLLESTIHKLNTDNSLTRKNIKLAVASLTIGSGSAAVVLAHRDISKTGHRLLGGVVHANTRFSHLCQSDTDQSGGDSMSPLMWTDSESLMNEGIKTAKSGFDRFLHETDWTRDAIDKTFCHQVGKMHEKLLFETLELDKSINYSTLEQLGNTGSAALPTAASLGIENGHVAPGERVALLGIGSGINTIMLGVEWGDS
jgi:acyl-CoA:acyl-CoA alkyltransferase